MVLGTEKACCGLIAGFISVKVLQGGLCGCLDLVKGPELLRYPVRHITDIRGDSSGCAEGREDLWTPNTMVPGLDLFRKRNKAGKGSPVEAVGASPDGVLQVTDPKRRSLSEAPAGIDDSAHNLHNMDAEVPSSIAKKSPPPSPTSTLPEVNFLDLSGSGSDGKGSERSSTSPDEEHTLTLDDPEWVWHEIPAEVDPKDAATPDK